MDEPLKLHNHPNQDDIKAKDGQFPKPKKERPKHWKFFTELELIVLQSLKGKTLTSKGLANLLDIENSSTFRTQLANLVERMIIIRTRNGYRINR